MTLPRQTFIAPHLREHIFRTYEDLLARAVAAWPSPTSFTVPHNVAPATFVANLRNAVVSVKRYNWQTSIDLPKLLSIESPRTFVIVFDDAERLVWFRSPKKSQVRGLESTVGTRVENHQVQSENAALRLVPWRDWTREELDALTLLIDKQRFVGPFILDGRVLEADVEFYQNARNVAIVYDSTLKQTIIT